MDMHDIYIINIIIIRRATTWQQGHNDEILTA